MAAGAAAWSGFACHPARPPLQAGMIAVLPFSMEPASDGWMGEALAEETGGALARGGIGIAPLDNPGSAEYRLAGTVANGAVVAARVRLSRKTDSLIVLEQVFQLAPESLGTLPGRIASVVTDAFGRHTDPAARPAPTRAYLTYLRALAYGHSRDTSDLRWAAELFRQVIAADSEFAPAWNGLAGTLQVLAAAGGQGATVLETERREAVRRGTVLDSLAAAAR